MRYRSLQLLLLAALAEVLVHCRPWFRAPVPASKHDDFPPSNSSSTSSFVSAAKLRLAEENAGLFSDGREVSAASGAPHGDLRVLSPAFSSPSLNGQEEDSFVEKQHGDALGASYQFTYKTGALQGKSDEGIGALALLEQIKCGPTPAADAVLAHGGTVKNLALLPSPYDRLREQRAIGVNPILAGETANPCDEVRMVGDILGVIKLALSEDLRKFEEGLKTVPGGGLKADLVGKGKILLRPAATKIPVKHGGENTGTTVAGDESLADDAKLAERIKAPPFLTSADVVTFTSHIIGGSVAEGGVLGFPRGN